MALVGLLTKRSGAVAARPIEGFLARSVNGIGWAVMGPIRRHEGDALWWWSWSNHSKNCRQKALASAVQRAGRDGIAGWRARRPWRR